MDSPLSRRRVIAFGLAAACIVPPRTARATAPWEDFKARFVTPEGRVRDNANQDISHSEGQAWGMLLAARHGDAVAFRRIHLWTLARLGLRSDRLLAWRFVPGPGGGVRDLNNATDGDLYHALALLTAERRWPGHGYAMLARRVAEDLLRQAVRQVGPRCVLLPGSAGFEAAGHVEVNPSYYAFVALDALAAAFPDQPWALVAREGEALLAEARFGRFGLPPDWLRMERRGGALVPVRGRGDRFGYDAIRVPLNLVWGGRAAHPVVKAAARFWSNPDYRHVPAWVRLSTEEISPYPAGPGALAIAWLVLAQRAGWGELSAMPSAQSAHSYYDAALALLAREAWRDLTQPPSGA
ncbi:glycosyl hydrolase family 8 [Falsiroseomonas selenitidurans]|uniref:cellulase n=1 Tax=Falsiroseomonas selenitidurans TaxID=2716335 RepID=A0ABX1E9A1_9PROT|nr:glycosyl hydrolase family 8 [Falsiroseomonas selenitidurans]NKC33403.1 glycosyl hydrolase family 5 [Falsiroseomonas selenitidurans]